MARPANVVKREIHRIHPSAGFRLVALASPQKDRRLQICRNNSQLMGHASKQRAPLHQLKITELTHAYQHLAAHSALDKQWAGRVELAFTDHALWLDRHKSAGNEVAARLNSMAANLASNANTNTTGATAGATTGATEGATAPAPDATYVALRARVQAQDAAMGARLDATEACLRETIVALDTGLRVHVQEAVAHTQLALRSIGEKVQLLDTACGLSSDAPSSPRGSVPPEARAAVEAADTRRRFSELELRLYTAETLATEQKADRLGTERDLCGGLTSLREDVVRLESQASAAR